MNLWRHSAMVEQFVRGKRLGRIAAQLLEVSGVRLYHDQALYKEPGGGITPTHADQYYWPMASDRAITAWVPLQAVPADMGPLEFYAGSQTVEFGRELPISDESEQQITRNMLEQGFSVISEPFDLGEVSFHQGWLFHRAGANQSEQARAVMTVIYMDAQMRLKEGSLNAAEQKDWGKWCPQALQGQVIDTPMNPVIYSQD
jgi:ectoine hydroxylase-related dioxygenase (phytanoyl-CoA dioxygenase family)